MAFSAVFQWVPGDEQGLNRFLLEHYLEHQLFYTTLAEAATPIATVNLPIQRIGDWPVWLADHQEMSQSVWTALGGGQNVDFGRVNYKDPDDLQDWMQAHNDWHTTVRDALGL